jgi:D-alanyl-D-alanine carboxypeptidase
VDAKDLSKQSFNIGDDILTGTVYVNNKEYTTLDLEAGVSRHYESLFPNKANAPAYLGAAAICIAGVFGLRKFVKNKYKK